MGKVEAILSQNSWKEETPAHREEFPTIPIRKTNNMPIFHPLLWSLREQTEPKAQPSPGGTQGVAVPVEWAIAVG